MTIKVKIRKEFVQFGVPFLGTVIEYELREWIDRYLGGFYSERKGKRNWTFHNYDGQMIMELHDSMKDIAADLKLRFG